MDCPECHSRATGRIGAGEYYCWDCCIEFRVNETGTEIFALDEEGERIPLAEGGVTG